MIKRLCVFGVAAMALCSWTLGVRADEPTAFSLAKEGNRYLGEQSRDKVVQIRSEKSVQGLTPNLWYVVYYDPTTTFNAVEIKFGAGKMLHIKRPTRLLEPITGDDKVLNREKFKVDSDKAILTASKEPTLDRLTLRATQLWLQRSDEGPVWKVRFWGAKFRKPGDDADIGDIYVSAADGRIIRTDLHIDRLD